ncbi:MAG TPA: hypothetical protein VFZ09_35905 [Archangium sp.]|uniref:hypothetical protein n=1 Tax=Archangium sp. TaxID=1872627 RepID=UPI002E354EAC|nr:hypothetical protein [Archangium sp.]HEX5751662.1 hypothetical protein [Archangium sp.]
MRNVLPPRSVLLVVGAFRLADDGEDEPVEELKRALVERGGQAPEWWVLGFGEGRDVPPVRADAALVVPAPTP